VLVYSMVDGGVVPLRLQGPQSQSSRPQAAAHSHSHEKKRREGHKERGAAVYGICVSRRPPSEAEQCTGYWACCTSSSLSLGSACFYVPFSVSRCRNYSCCCLLRTA